MEFYKQKHSPTRAFQAKRPQSYTIKAQCSPEAKEEEKCVLQLKPFVAAAHVAFDKVKVGSSKTCTIYIFNPLEVEQSVCLEKFPFEKGFNIANLEFCVPPFKEIGIEVTWTPEKSLSCRETVLFKTSAGIRAQAFFYGTALSPKKQKARKCWNKKALQKSLKLDIKNPATSKRVTESIAELEEDIKENVNFVNQKFDVGGSASGTPYFVPMQPACLKPIEDITDSPIRRQTYTINSMLRESCIGTDIKNIPFYLPRGNAGLKESHADFKNIHQSVKPVIQEVPNISQLIQRDKNQVFNDSLDSVTCDLDECAGNDDHELINCPINSTTYDTFIDSSTACTVKTLDPITKHLFFGYTPIKKQEESRSDIEKCKIDQATKGSIPYGTLSLADEIRNSTCSSIFQPVHPNVESFISTCMPTENLVPSLNPSNLEAVSSCCSSTTPEEIQVNTISDSTCISSSNYLGNTVGISDHAVISNSTEANCNEHEKNVQDSVFESEVCSDTSVCNLADKMHGTKRFYSTGVENLEGIKKPCSVAFVVPDLGNPKPSEATFHLSSFQSSKQKRTAKYKHRDVTIPKKKISTLKLSKKTADPLPSSKMKAKSPLDKDRKRLPQRLPQRLHLIKNNALGKFIQRNPYATFNAYYDEYWKEKQESAFTNWLNFILTFNDEFGSADVKVNSAEIWVESMKDAVPIRAPSKEELSFKTYTAIKQLNQLRKAACTLYQSEKLTEVIKRIEKEVDLKKIIVRKDRATHADLGIKQELLQMLLSYNPLWLRIGLETIYGEMIPLQNNNDVIGLSRFIIHRFLSNPDIASKYAHSSVINYFKQGYEDNMKRYTLKKFLMLVFFLDVAKRARLINHNPCLFCKSAKYKDSRSLLLTFSREYLSGEGDITKHLRYLGYVVEHVQLPIEEFDYAVRNIAVDLRCGLRLGRVVEILLQDWSIFSMLRSNTLNRLAKIHNNEVILQALQKASIEIEDNIDPRDIVDGNREKTLSLLWQIIFKTQISKHVNLELLKKENSYLIRSLRLKADVAAFNALQNLADEADDFEMEFLNSKLYKENEVIQQLLQWCQNVCAHYGVKVQNFTSSFSDGRALCFIVHHYHPNLLPRTKIHEDTSTRYFEKQMEAAENECPFPADNGEMGAKLLDKLVKNENENLELIFQKLQEIGQIPILSFPTHFGNTLPDEKVVITLVSYINIRLMELSVEIRAARTILLAYRRWCLRKKLKKLKDQILAAVKIQRCWRNYVIYKRKEKEKAAAISIQRCWKMHSAKTQLKHLKQEKYIKLINTKAAIIQEAFRKYRASKNTEQRNRASVLLQSHIRKWIARTRFLQLKGITIKIQKNYRAKVMGRIDRRKFLHAKKNIILLQALVRGTLLRKQIEKEAAAAVIIQSCIRMWLARKWYTKQLNACICIQRRFRSLLLTRKCSADFQKIQKSTIIIQKWYLLMRRKQLEYKSAVKIQSCLRGYLQRKRYILMRLSALRIQQWWRARIIGQQTRSLFLMKREQVILLQSHVRRMSAQKSYVKKRKSIVLIQRNVRKAIAQKRFSLLKSSALYVANWWANVLLCRKVRLEYVASRKAAIKIQATWRMHCAKKSLNKLKNAVSIIELYRIGKKQRLTYLKQKENIIKLQALFRQYKCRKEFCLQKKAATIIQSVFRGYNSRKRYFTLKSCAIKIQKYYRCCQLMYVEKGKYLVMKNGFTKLQARYRGRKLRKEFCIKKSAAIMIQSVFRCYTDRKKFLTLRSSAVKVQKYYRGYQLMCSQRQDFLDVKNGFTKLQALLRGYKARGEYRKKKSAAVQIQSAFRGYSCKKKYLTWKLAAIKIQKHYRGYRLMCIEKQKFKVMKSGFTKLQAQFHGCKAREKFYLQKKAIVRIQSVFRGYSSKKNYGTLKSSSVKIQKYYRSYRLMCIEKQKFQVMKSGFTRLQARFRGYLARKEFFRLKTSVIVIQSAFRGFSSKKKFLRLKSSTIKIQRYFRGYQLTLAETRNFQLMKTNVIKLQARLRGYIAKKKYCQQKNSAVVIQSAFRAYNCRKKFLHLKLSAIKIQKYYRGYLLACAEKQKFLIVKNGFTRLQAQFRGYRARKEYLKKKASVIVIQSAFRGYSSKKKFLTLKSSTIKIQKFYQSYQLTQREKHKFLIMKTGFTRLQAQLRGYKVRKYLHKQNKAAVCVQSAFRAYIGRKKFLLLKSSATKIQKYYRSYQLMCINKQKYLVMKTGFTRLQATYRGIKVRENLKVLQISAVTIQSYYRKMVAMRRFNKLKQMCIFVQQKYRAQQAMKESLLKYQNIRQKIILIQAAVRCYLSRKKYLIMKKAAIRIQSFIRMSKSRNAYMNARSKIVFVQQLYRSKCLMNSQRSSYLNERQKIILLQKRARGVIAKRNFLKVKNACILIQSVVKMWVEKRKYSQLKHAAESIQKQFRNQQVTKRVRNEYLMSRRACIKIQSYARMVLVRRNFLKIRCSCIIIQSLYKMHVVRGQFLKMKQSVSVLQKHVIAWKIGKEERQRYLLVKKSVLSIQRYFRLWKEKRSNINTDAQEQHLWYLRLRDNVVKFQYQARIYIQRRERAAIKIQAAWRAYAVRRAITDKNIIESRRNIKKASSDEDNTLRNRTKRALDILLANKCLRTIITALQNLDVCTRLSPVCCERLVQSKGLSVILYIVRSCNRSVPHKEIILSSTSILLNLAKYVKTVENVWVEEEALSIILELMSIYKEKGPEIFTKCCSLFWIFCQDPVKAEILKTNSEFTEKIQRFYAMLVKKKENEEKRVFSRSTTAATATKVKFMKRYLAHNSRESIRIEPDWMLGRNRRREFNDSFIAVSSLMHSLGLKT